MSAASIAAERTDRLSFHLPPELEASEPPEARGTARDGVRMLVAERGSGRLTHSTFDALPSILEPGDLLVINTSAVIPAAIDAVAADGTRLVVHLSTELDDGTWVVELRRLAGSTTARWTAAEVPRHLVLGEGATLDLVAPYLDSTRLSVAALSLPTATLPWLERRGRAIRYGYVEHAWPMSAYQNVYSVEPGSAEMPSAGRPFTAELITRLVSKGVDVAPVVLHTGVASLESTELPYPERVHVPATTADRINVTRATGGRVIAVGTTAVRSIESAADDHGRVAPFDGWTDLVITPQRGVHAIAGLITGWHEPEASHLLMLEAIAGRDLLESSYAASIDAGYRWHEFGDIHLILP